VPRRVSLPGASELFRSTDRSGDEESTAPRPPLGSGRVRHEEKITVYVSSDELLALEQARLTLRGRHGMAVDRGRIVREAMSAILADFSEHGHDSELVQRLSAGQNHSQP
jgi:hypothetical protein